MRWPRPLLPFLHFPHPHRHSRSHSTSTSTELSLTESLLSLFHSLPLSSPSLPLTLHQLSPFLTKHVIIESLLSLSSPIPAFHLFLVTSSFTHLRSVNSQKRMVDLFAQNPDSIDEALDLLIGFKENAGWKIGSAGFEPVIEGLVKSGLFDKAVEVFEKMTPEFGIKPNSAVYNIMIKMFMEKEVILLAMAVYNQMVKANCSPNRFTYAILMDGLCKSGMVTDAFNLFDKMLERGLSPDSGIYNIILTSFFHSGRINEALKLFDSMKNRGFELNKVDINSLLNGLCKAGRVEEAFALLKTFQQKGFVLGLKGYNILIEGLFKIGKFNEACRYFREMIKNGIKPDVIVYTIMIKGHANFGRVEDCFSLLNEMIGTGLVPDTFCYNTVIKACCDSNLLDRAKSLKLEISKNNLFPDSATHTILISGLCNAGLINEAQEVFDEMSKLGCQPTVYTFNSLLNGLCKAGKVKQANILFYKMEMGQNTSLFLRLTQGTDRVHDAPSLKRRVSSLCQAGRVLEAYKILRGIIESGAIPDIITYNILINGFCKTGNLNYGLKLFKEMQMKGHKPDKFTYCTVINALLKVGREEEASRIFNHVLETGFKPLRGIYYSFMANLGRNERVSHAIPLWFDYLSREYGTDLKAGEEISRIKFFYKNGFLEETIRGLVKLDSFYNKFISCDPYSIWLTGFCQASRVGDAYTIFKVLNEFNIDLNPPVCNNLIQCLDWKRDLIWVVNLVFYSVRKGCAVQRVVNGLVKRLFGGNRVFIGRLFFARLIVAGYDLERYIWPTTKMFLMGCERRLVRLKEISV